MWKVIGNLTENRFLVETSNYNINQPVSTTALPVGKTRRVRIEVSTLQHEELQMEFHQNKYIRRPRRIQLAQTLNLKKRQIKIWFQNRRMKHKKEQKLGYLSPPTNSPSSTCSDSSVNVRRRKKCDDRRIASAGAPNNPNQQAYVADLNISGLYSAPSSILMTKNQGLDSAQFNHHRLTLPHPYVQGWYPASCTQFDAHQHMNVPQPNLQELLLPAAEYNWEGNGMSADIF
ncbi:hypothetical protein HHI36_023963 [Cryptolaemus montrouzieri]|uniref:Homeobox domain-containing protein n=1 Tax=Cryptolaemus montrouzieri TaxID=559131 RepID=A0ABD2NYI1_9CUCU